MGETCRPPTRVLLCAYYPQQLLPGLAAVIQLRKYLGHPVTASVTLLVWSDPGVGAPFLQLRCQAFKRLLQAFPWVELVFPSPEEIRTALSPNFRVRSKARWLLQRFGEDSFAAVHYAHDIGSDYLAQSAMQAFPHAVRACFGDALGVFYTNDYYTRLTYPLAKVPECFSSPWRTLINIFWRLKRAYTLPLPHRRLDANFAIPILLCDPGGDFLSGKTLLHVERDTLNQVLEGLAEGTAMPDSETFTDMHLMLLGSYCESGFTSEDSEIDLYLEAARLHVPLGEPILLKAHPASYGNKVQKLAQALQAQYPVTLSDADPLPIEAMRHFAHCRSVISFSYSSVSLHYLYGSAVVHALTDEMINAHFPLSIRPWMLESNTLYLNQLKYAKHLRTLQLAETGTTVTTFNTGT